MFLHKERSEKIKKYIKDLPYTKTNLIKSLQNKGLSILDNTSLSSIPKIINSSLLSGSWVDPNVPTYTCQLNFVFNSEHTDFQIPNVEDEMNALLKNAFIEVQPLNTSESYNFPITSLDPNTPTSFLIATPIEIEAIVRVHLGEIDGKLKYCVPPGKIKLIPNTSFIYYLQTQKQTSIITFYERIQIKGSGANVPNTSYRRKRTIDENGKSRIYFGGFQSDGKTWIDQSMMSMSVWTCTPEISSTNDNGETVITPATFNKEFIYDGGGGDATDMTDVFKNEFNLHRVNVVVHTNGLDVENHFMQINQVWCKIAEEDVEFYIYNDDGTIKETTIKKCIVTSITSTPNQAGYHLHSAFIKPIRNDDGSLDISNESQYAYMACYRTSSKSVKNTSNKAQTIYCSVPNNAIPTCSNRSNTVDFCKNNNQFDVSIIDNGNIIKTLSGNTDVRRFTGSTSFDVDLQTLLSYIVFGVDPQAYLKGVTSSSRERCMNGETKFMLDNGILFGAVNDRNTTNPIIVFGVEESTWSSTGIFENNITFVHTRHSTDDLVITPIYDSNNNLLSGNVTSGTINYGEWLVAIDKNDITPAVNDYDTLIENGYSSMGFTVINSTNRRQGYDERFGLRDIYLPISNQDDLEYNKNITIGAIDTFWMGSSPAVSAWQAFNQDIINNNLSADELNKLEYHPLRNYFLVVSGSARNSGSSLGSFCRSAADLGIAAVGSFVAFLSFQP